MIFHNTLKRKLQYNKFNFFVKLKLINTNDYSHDNVVYSAISVLEITLFTNLTSDSTNLTGSYNTA